MKRVEFIAARIDRTVVADIESVLLALDLDMDVTLITRDEVAILAQAYPEDEVWKNLARCPTLIAWDESEGWTIPKLERMKYVQHNRETNT